MQQQYLTEWERYCQLNDGYGFQGTLFFQNMGNDLDPWVGAQELLHNTNKLSPFVAVNPAYTHPYAIAMKILNLSRLYRRRIYLNFIAGTSISEMESLGVMLDHSRRYDRLVEYIEIIQELLRSSVPLTYNGQSYRVKNLALPYALDKDLFPQIFIAGGSAEAEQARLRTGAGSITMARPLRECIKNGSGANVIHFGIIAAPTTDEARRMMSVEFCMPDFDGSELLELSMLNTDAAWKQQLKGEVEDEIYRLEPFRFFNADCPYLVGSYSEVAAYLQKYISMDVNAFIIEASEKTLPAVDIVLRQLKELVSQTIK
jgi:alkanesulfonate monooxygenase